MDEPVDQPLLPGCGVARFLVLLEGPWATLIVRELLHGPRRFTELKRALPGDQCSHPHQPPSSIPRVRPGGAHAYDETPPRVVHRLTPLAQGLRGVLAAMNDWALTVPDTAHDQEPQPAS